MEAFGRAIVPAAFIAIAISFTGQSKNRLLEALIGTLIVAIAICALGL